jgi:ATP-dependent Clp protease ATP-binding subunit ClpC
MNWFESANALLARWKSQAAAARKARTEKFTPNAQQALTLAHSEAVRLNHNFIGTEHLLLGCLRLNQCKAAAVLLKLGLDLEKVRLKIEKSVGHGFADQQISARIPATPRVKKILHLAQLEAKELNHPRIGTEHLLLGLLRERDGVAGRVLNDLGVTYESTRPKVLADVQPL